MGKAKQMTILFFIFVMILGCVYLGYKISIKPEEPSQINEELGDYEEINIPLPVLNEAKGEEFLQLTKNTAEQVELFSVLYNEDKTRVRGYKKYLLTSDNKWEESEADWMSLEQFGDSGSVIRSLQYASTGTIYLLMHSLVPDEEGTVIPDEVIRITTDSIIEHVGVRGLYKTDENGAPISIHSMFLYGNMICITDELGRTYAYSLANGTLLAEYDALFETAAQSANHDTLILPAAAAAADASYLYHINNKYNAIQPIALKSDDTASDSDAVKETVSFSPSLSEYPLWDTVTLCVPAETEHDIRDFYLLQNDNALYLTCRNGIYSYDHTAGIWNSLIPGTSCIFGRPSVAPENMIALKDTLYVFSNDYTGNHYLTSYVRNKELKTTEIKTTMTISSYRRHAILTEAIAVYTAKHPDTKIVYQVALEDNPQMTITEFKEQTDRALQSGTAADLLVCDELDYDSYMKAGCFENISELMKPMYTSANLFGNTVNALAQTKIFLAPAKFSALIAYGQEDIVNRLSDINALTDWAKKKGLSAFSGFTVAQLSSLLSRFYEEEYWEDGQIQPDKLNALLTLVKDNSSIAYSSPKAEKDWYYLSPSAELSSSFGITKLSSRADFRALKLALAEKGYSYAGAAGRFLPECILAINAKSSQIKPAKEFLRTLYSKNVQNQNIGHGLPMGIDALNEWTDDVISETDIAKLSRELSRLNYALLPNDELYRAVFRVMELFLAGEMTAEQAAAAIMDYDASAPVTAEPAQNISQILFIGEAFTDSSGLIPIFHALCLTESEDLTVWSCVHTQESLKEQVKYTAEDKYQTYSRIRTADVVVLQEKPGALSSTVASVHRILSCCKPNAVIYYLVTEDAVSTDLAERLEIFPNLKLISIGEIAEQLAQDHSTDITLNSLGSHATANALYGYITALATYHKIFGALPDIRSLSELETAAGVSILSLAPGEDDAKKQAALNALPDLIVKFNQ